MSDNVNHPKHYQPRFKSRTIECIEFSRLMPFSLGNAFKYIWRAGSKGGKKKAIEDLEKAKWYLNDFRQHNTVYGQYPTLDVHREMEPIFAILVPEDTIRYDMLVKIAMFGKTDFSDTIWQNLRLEVLAEAERTKNAED